MKIIIGNGIFEMPNPLNREYYGYDSKSISLNSELIDEEVLDNSSIVDELSDTQTKFKKLKEELDIVKSILLINKRNNLHNINNTNVDETLDIIESNKKRLADKISELEIKKMDYINSQLNTDEEETIESTSDYDDKKVLRLRKLFFRTNRRKKQPHYYNDGTESIRS